MSSEVRAPKTGGAAGILVASTFTAALAALVLYFLLYQPRVRELEVARREASLCVQERAALKGRVSDLEAMLDDLRRESAELAEQIRLREEQLAQAQTTQ